MAMQNHATGPAGQTIARGNMKVIRLSYTKKKTTFKYLKEAGVTLTNYTNYPILNFLFIIMMI